MEQIDNTFIGYCFFKTENGSRYFIESNTDGKQLERENATHSLRRDQKKINLLCIHHLRIYDRAVLVLEPLGKGNCTTRYTSTVIEIIVFKNKYVYQEFRETLYRGYEDGK